MKTKVIHQGPGHYNFTYPSQITEHWTFIFDETDPEHTTVTFDYDKDEAPGIPNFRAMRIDELIEQIANFSSKRYVISSSHNHIGEKTHGERIEIAQKLAKKNLVDDLTAYRDLLQEQFYQLEEKLRNLYKEIAVEIESIEV